jgi:hypothetical protein
VNEFLMSATALHVVPGESVPRGRVSFMRRPKRFQKSREILEAHPDILKVNFFTAAVVGGY